MSKECCTNDENTVELEAVLSFDDRGQMVLPKDIRAKFNLKSGDKFALVSCKSGDDLCCFSLIKTDQLSGALSKIINPI